MTIYRKAQIEDLAELKQICLLCFEEGRENIDFMFNGYISPEIGYCAQAGSTLVAALYLVPCKMTTKQGVVKGHYLYGASTIPEFRKQGIMNRLIAFALQQAQKEGHLFSALLPASEPLYGFYNKMGYKALYRAKSIEQSPESMPDGSFDNMQVINNSFDNIEQLRFNICKDFFGTILWDKKVLSFAAAGARRSAGGLLCGKQGYMLYSRDSESSVFVSECMCKPEDYPALLQLLKEQVPAKRYTLRLPPWLESDKKEENFGMVRFLSDNTLSMDSFVSPYLGLTFD